MDEVQQSVYNKKEMQQKRFCADTLRFLMKKEEKV